MAADITSSSLPLLEWLRVFETAARTESFTAAVAELGLTQAAIRALSKQKFR